MAERVINPLLNIHSDKKYREVIFLNSYKVTGDFHPKFLAVKNAIEGTGVSLTVAQRNAGDRLVRDLHSETNANYATYDIWNVELATGALYGILGGIAAAHKFNWINPLDNNSAFRLLFINSPTHDIGGIDWNGIDQYAGTSISPSANLSLDNTHLSYYSTENVTGNSVDIGGGNSGSQRLLMSIDYSGTGVISDAYSTGSGRIIAPNADKRGFFLASKSASIHEIFRNGVSLGSNATSGGTLPTAEILLGANGNAGAPSDYSSRKCALASVGKSITGARALGFYNAVQAYQTTLGRHV